MPKNFRMTPLRPTPEGFRERDYELGSSSHVSLVAIIRSFEVHASSVLHPLRISQTSVYRRDGGRRRCSSSTAETNSEQSRLALGCKCHLITQRPTDSSLYLRFYVNPLPRPDHRARALFTQEVEHDADDEIASLVFLCLIAGSEVNLFYFFFATTVLSSLFLFLLLFFFN